MRVIGAVVGLIDRLRKGLRRRDALLSFPLDGDLCITVIPAKAGIQRRGTRHGISAHHREIALLVGLCKGLLDGRRLGWGCSPPVFLFPLDGGRLR